MEYKRSLDPNLTFSFFWSTEKVCINNNSINEFKKLIETKVLKVALKTYILMELKFYEENCLNKKL